ncbi:MAG TPA: hypothetical protein VGK73_32825 [Polyangiaceae bacterium]
MTPLSRPELEELLCTPAPPSREEQGAFLLWATYYVSTENFDRTLPGVWSQHDRDVWMPFDMRSSQRHAHTMRGWVRREAERLGIPAAILEDQRHLALGTKHAELVRILAAEERRARSLPAQPAKEKPDAP